MREFDLNLPEHAARTGALVAWSGGLDSTVLLHLMQRWAQKTGALLAAAHIDHGLRPSSGEDARFCRRYAANVGVPLVVEKLQIRPDGSSQQNARLQRYAALARVAGRLGLGLVVTAHHADDALETAFLNMRRGTSSGGMSTLLKPGGAPVPAWPDNLALARPLIRYTRAQILAFAQRHQVAWHEDPTNTTTDYARNKLRIDVMDRLSEAGKYLPGMLDTLQNLAEERDALQTLAAEALARAMLSALDAEAVALRSAPIRALPAALITLGLQQAARQLPAEVAFSRVHLRRVVDAIYTGSRLRLDIRGGVVYVARALIVIEVSRGRGGRFLHDRRAEPIRVDPGHHPATTPWFGTTIRREALALDDEAARGPQNRTPNGAEAAFYYDTTSPAPLLLRGPAPGDRVNVRGMKGHKLLADILSEAGVPAFLRWRWPCLARADSSQQIQWVCGLRHAAPDGHPVDRPPGSPSNSTAGHILRYHWSLPSDSIFSALLAP